jgi:murein DD-endopeptidase MepM/ murein hydrolase activator NlpD
MSDWQRRGMHSAGRGKDKPRFKPLVVAAPIAVLLLFSTLTGHVDLINAVTPDSNKIDQVLQQKAAIERAAMQAAVRAGEAGSNAEPGASLAPTATPNGSATATSVPGVGCEPSGDPRFCLYTIAEGDSLASIATRFGLDGGEVPGWELLFESNKEDLAGLEEVLVPGWVLRVPNSEAVLHLVLPGDSISAVAGDYGVTTESIVSANGLADPDNVQIGDILLVPSPSQVPVIPPPAPIVEEVEEPSTDPENPEADGDAEDAEAEEEAQDEQDAESPEAEETQDTSETEEEAEGTGTEDQEEDQPDEEGTEDGGEGDEQDGSQDGGEQDGAEEDAEVEETPEPAADDASSMSWPVVQPVRITNYMTARHPLGMDFGLYYAPTSSIMAAAGGTVSFAGGDPCCSYGYYVIVDHGDGLQTLYAHLSSISVRKGETVGRSQSLGIAGNTGNSRGVHLHFEVYKNGKRVDPMLYLPR